jgi:NADPH:quinone reductase
VYNRTGHYAMPVPFTPGSEVAGVVDEIGPGVTTVTVGERVAYSGAVHGGAYAELSVIPAERAVALPAGVSTKQGAAAMLQGMTAQYLAMSTFPLAPGHVALVHAAAGGTGLLLTQIARRRGARVIGTTSTPEKAALAAAAGASDVILYTEQDFEEEAKRLTAGGMGVDVVYDSVGKTTFDKSLRSLRHRGMMVLFGGSSGPVPPIDPLLLTRLGSLYLTRPSLGHYTADPAEMRSRAADVLSWIADGSLKVRIGHEYPLSQAADAQRALESRATTGKILLIP